ncbi:MAG: Adenylate/guanylate cyclase [Pedosphaera sp.]|nr:Adenylate/guanylate cyclase [Pedosphaera sp.]
MPAKTTVSKSSVIIRSLGYVLIVDDEEYNRTLLRDPLEALGHEVEEAANGMEAFHKIAVRLPDVILLDLMMPRMDGFEVCRRIRANAQTAHIPILMITALSERGDRLLGIQAGANDFLNKPIDLQDVILRVGNAMYAKHLRDQLQAEQEKSERLLLNILPKPIAERMKKGETNIADSHPDVTVLVADLVGFTSLTAHIEPAQVVLLLNEIFSAFDVLVGNYGLEKIKTMGEAYMVAGGIFNQRTDHVEACADLAIDLRHEMERFNRQNDTSIRLRIGISTGPVVSGVIGRQKFAYDVWGETVNLACRMEATAKVGRIQISGSAYQRLREIYEFDERQDAGTGRQSDPPAYWLGSRIGSPVAVETHAAVVD